MSVGQDWGIHLLHLDLKDTVTPIKNMGIEHLNADQRQNPTSQIRERRIMHLTMHVPNVTSLDIKARIVEIKYI